MLSTPRKAANFFHEICAVTERNISADDFYLHILYIVLWNNLSSVEIQILGLYKLVINCLIDAITHTPNTALLFLSVCSAIFDITKTTPF